MSIRTTAQPGASSAWRATRPPTRPKPSRRSTHRRTSASSASSPRTATCRRSRRRRPLRRRAPMAQSPPAKPLEGGARLAASLAVGLATFMNVLDTSIANVSIPAIAGDLGVSPNQGTWIITSFAVANAISVPLTGWLTQRFGQVRLFLATTALFVLASLLCGLAVSMPMLVFFRVIQGAVAGPMIPLSQTLLLSTYPREKAGMALATFSLTILVAPVVGPVLGGWITDNFSWPVIVALAVTAAFAFCLFLVWELTEEHPVVDLALFRNRNFSTGTLAIALAYGAYFGSIVLLPLWLQQFMGYTATDAGLVLAPVGILALILTPLVGRSSGKVDPRLFATASLLIFAVVAWMRSRFNTQVDLWTLVVPTILQGAAVSCFFVPLVNLALGGLRPDQIAAASGLNNFLRITAGAFATSTATTLWENRAALHHAQLVEHLTPGDPQTNATLTQL